MRRRAAKHARRLQQWKPESRHSSRLSNEGLLVPSIFGLHFVYLNSGFLHCDPSTFCFLLFPGLLLLKALCVHSCASSHIISILLFALTIHYGFPMKIILTPCTVERLVISRTSNSSSGEATGRPNGGSRRGGRRASHESIGLE